MRANTSLGEGEPRGMEDAKRDVLDALELSQRISANAGYDEFFEKAISRLILNLPQELRDLIKTIWKHDPYFPKNRSFTDAWCLLPGVINGLLDEVRVEGKTESPWNDVKDTKTFFKELAADEGKLKQWIQEHRKITEFREGKKEALDNFISQTLAPNLNSILINSRTKHFHELGIDDRYIDDIYNAFAKRFDLEPKPSQRQREFFKSLNSLDKEGREAVLEGSRRSEEFKQKILGTKARISQERSEQIEKLVVEMENRIPFDDLYLILVSSVAANYRQEQEKDFIASLIPDWHETWKFFERFLIDDKTFAIFDEAYLSSEIENYRRGETDYLLRRTLHNLKAETQKLIKTLNIDYGLVEPELTFRELVRLAYLPDGAFVRWEEKLQTKLRKRLGQAEKEALEKAGLTIVDGDIDEEKPFKDVSDDTSLLKFKRQCEELGLEKRKTIPPETLYEIMCTIGGFSGSIEEFTTKCAGYVKGREYASRLGYTRKGSDIY